MKVEDDIGGGLFLYIVIYFMPPHLLDFTMFWRTRPLFDLDGDLGEVLKDFDGKFERGELAGWAKEQQGAMAHTGAHLDLSAFDSAEELASLGLDRYRGRRDESSWVNSVPEPGHFGRSRFKGPAPA